MRKDQICILQTEQVELNNEEECNRHGLSYSTKPKVEKEIRVAKRFNFAGRSGGVHYRARFN